MKKLIAIVLLALTTACAQTETSSMGSGMMCEKCPCCQKMMEGKDGMKMDGMKDGMMKSGMQCPMMQGNGSGRHIGDVLNQLELEPNHNQN